MVPTEDAALAGLCPPCEADATIAPYSGLRTIVPFTSAGYLLRQKIYMEWALLGNGLA